MYLERFARQGRVNVRRRDGKSVTTSTINVAVESGFYDVRISGDAGSPSKVVEETLADVEGAVGAAFEVIDRTGASPRVHSDERGRLATYLALQMTRTPEHRERTLFPERLASYLGDRELTLESVTDYLREVHLGFVPSASESQGAFEFASVALRDRGIFTPEFAMSAMLRSVSQLVPLFEEMSWTVEHERKGRFITSDTPLVMWRQPTERDEYEGVGVASADELRFPLDPTKQLILSRKSRAPSCRVTPGRAEACNVDISSGCHQFIIGHPDETGRMEALPLVTHRPVLRFNSGPLYEKGAYGKSVYKGDMIHAWVPRR